MAQQRAQMRAQKMDAERQHRDRSLLFQPLDFGHLLRSPVGAADRNHLDFEADRAQSGNFSQDESMVRRRVLADQIGDPVNGWQNAILASVRYSSRICDNWAVNLKLARCGGV